MKRKLFTRKTLMYLVVAGCGIMIYFALANFAPILAFISWLGSVFSPFIAGAIIAFLLHMPMKFFEEGIFYKVRRKRAISILLTYILALTFIYFLFMLVVPQMI